VAPPRRALARTAALPAPGRFPSLRRWLPSTRSLLLGVTLVALAVGGYVAARETSVFAIHSLAVRGGSEQLQAEVQDALAPELGRSLVAIGAGDVEQRLAAVPGVLAVRIDRSFPHTLKVVVTPERPVLLVRRGKDTWVVSARGRVLRKVANPGESSLPRLWAPKGTPVRVNRILSPERGGAAATALAPLAAARFPAHVRTVRAMDGELTLVLRSGLELRLGDTGDLRLKLAVARKLLLIQGPDPSAAYIDVSVPQRPVAG